jgi:hypothetical protein
MRLTQEWLNRPRDADWLESASRRPSARWLVTRTEQHMDLQTGGVWEQGAVDSLWT